MSQSSSKVSKNFWFTHIISSWLNLCLPSVREPYFSKGSPLGTLHLNNQSPRTGPQQEKAVFFSQSVRLKGWPALELGGIILWIESAWARASRQPHGFGQSARSILTLWRSTSRRCQRSEHRQTHCDCESVPRPESTAKMINIMSNNAF